MHVRNKKAWPINNDIQDTVYTAVLNYLVTCVYLPMLRDHVECRLVLCMGRQAQIAKNFNGHPKQCPVHHHYITELTRPSSFLACAEKAEKAYGYKANYFGCSCDRP